MRGKNAIHYSLTRSNQELRDSIYRGEIFRLPATRNSLGLVAAVRALINDRLGHISEDARQAQFHTCNEDFFKIVTAIRGELAEKNLYRSALGAVVAELGFDIGSVACDNLRLRAIQHGGHENPAAAAAYFAHRDTWYSNPQAQINFWIPLFDLSESQVFSFFPDYFDRPLKNSSALFNYHEFKKHVGWQSHRPAGERTYRAVYPTADEPFDHSGAIRFAMQAGEILIFSAAHLHQTCQNLSGETRFSLDFRLVDLRDHRSGKGAPNCDNESVGCTLEDYRTDFNAADLETHSRPS